MPVDPRWVTPLTSIVKDAMPERLSTAIWRSRVGAVTESTSPLFLCGPSQKLRANSSRAGNETINGCQALIATVC